MAAAYAALVSLMNTVTLEQVPRRPPYREISLDDGGLIQSLQERVYFLVEFLEEGWKRVDEHLKERIAEAAYAAEDAIDSHMVGQVLPTEEPGTPDEIKGSDLLCQRLRKIIQEMDSIKTEVEKIKQQSGINDEYRESSARSTGHWSSAPHGGDKAEETEDLNLVGRSTSVGSSSAPPRREMREMVGFEDEKWRVIEQLTWGNSGQTIIPIVGMGGAGKTTLARNIFDDLCIVQHFDVRIWVTVSQEYNSREILKGVLRDLNQDVNDEMDEITLGEKVHKYLFGRRCLVVLDDLWDRDAWDKIKRFFQGSHIMVTTRHSNLTKELSTLTIEMKHFDEDNSWSLFCQKVFQQNKCPPELEDVGKKISKNCKGLPLAIVVVGGLLAKFKDKKYWDHVAGLSSRAVHLDKSEQCSEILSLSYHYLPIHLKPCFLYLGVFPEDHKIRVSKLINLWVAEGFLKPLDSRNYEEIAEEYLKDLIERNLVMISGRGIGGIIEECTIHDLLKELCMREALKENFFCAVTSHNIDVLRSMKHPRRIAILLDQYPHVIASFLSKSRPRSLIMYDFVEGLKVLGSHRFRLLRVFHCIKSSYVLLEEIKRKDVSFNLDNLRYIAPSFGFWTSVDLTMLFFSIGLPRNLQIIDCEISNGIVLDISNLPHIRYVDSSETTMFGEKEQHDYVVLQNLQILMKLINFRFEERVLKTIPNIKKLVVYYTLDDGKFHRLSDFNFHNLGCLQKLESLNFNFTRLFPRRNELLRNLAFPNSLKRLSLKGCRLLWEDMSVIGSLPHLEVLKLDFYSFMGADWNLVEGEFIRLRCLCLYNTELINWNVDSIHFPHLEHLVLVTWKLKEIPPGIGDIPTLRLIEMLNCPYSAIISASSIVQEQRSFGNEELVVKVSLNTVDKSLHSSLEGNQFLVLSGE